MQSETKQKLARNLNTEIMFDKNIKWIVCGVQMPFHNLT